MRILFISSKLEPYTQNDAQAQVCATLARALKRSNHDVNIFAPFVEGSEHTGQNFARKLNPVRVELFGNEYLVDIYTTRTPAGVDNTLLRLRNADSIPASERTLAFTKSVAELIKTEPVRYDVVHAHGSDAATFFLWSEAEQTAPRKVATLYETKDLSADPSATASIEELVKQHALPQICQRGIARADSVTVLSSDLRDSTQKALHKERKEPVLTIGVGLDTAFWNPAVDPNLPTRFDPYHLDGKLVCKAALQKELDLPVRSDVPLVSIAIVGAAGQALLNAFAPDAVEIFQNNIQVVVLKFDKATDSSLLRELEHDFPDKLRVIDVDPSSALEHRIAGASDALLLPPLSTTEHLHLIALRYGSVPVVASDALAAGDIVDCDPQLQTGSGFIYESLDAASILNVLRRVTAAYQNTDVYRALQSKIMLIDHSWQKAIRRYERLYDRAS